MAAMSAARRWLATTAVGVGLSTSVVACTPPIEIGPRTVPVTTTTVAVGYPATPVGDDQNFSAAKALKNIWNLLNGP